MTRKTVAIVGGRESAEGIALEAAKLGMSPLVIEAIAFERRKLGPKGISALEKIGRFDWIFFTSRNAVSFFMDGSKARRAALPRTIKIAAVGPETAAALKKAGFRADFVPKRPSAQSLAKELGSAVRGKKILFPRSASTPVSREALASLRRNGARVTAIPVYATVPQSIPLRILKRLGQEIAEGRMVCLVFTSPSAVSSFVKNVKNIKKDIPAICIGPTTAAAVRAAGFAKIRVAKEPTAAGVASLLRSVP